MDDDIRSLSAQRTQVCVCQLESRTADMEEFDLPLRDAASVMQLNAKLSVQSMRHKLVLCLSEFTAEHATQSTYNICAKLFTNYCAMLFTWTGKSTNNSAKKHSIKTSCTNIIVAIKGTVKRYKSKNMHINYSFAIVDAVKCHPKVSSVGLDDEIRRAIGEWFRRGKERFDRESQA